MLVLRRVGVIKDPQTVQVVIRVRQLPDHTETSPAIAGIGNLDVQRSSERLRPPWRIRAGREASP